MYLKRIELLGFKSFGPKTDLDFQRGIIGIVGPNGCGKSNIVDSIRWVLGEQSVKSLRGNKMEDVIFNGTSKRKPLSVAEVAITFDNEDGFINLDFKEVTVTRRLYRNGESEYLLNKVPCRLRDINGLFIDTGIGREAYSIIGQGKIDAILSNRPEERRGIFEEAAGILKYKNRKREAERRLKETKDNILRIGDIISELKTQIEPLEEQAQVAREYIAFKEELDKLVAGLLFSEASSLKTRLERIQANLQNCQETAGDQTALLSKEEGLLTQMRWDLEKKGEEVSALQKKVYQVNEEMERGRSRVELIKEKLSSNASRLEKNKNEEAKAQEDLALAGKMQEELGEKEDIISRELDKLQRELTELEERKNSTEKKAGAEEMAALEEERQVQKERKYKIQAGIAALQEKERGLQDSSTGLEEQGKNLDLEREKITASLEDVLGERDGATARAKASKAALEGCLAEKFRLGEEILKKEQKTALLREEVRAVAEKHKTLQELDRNFAGYFQGVRGILKAKQAGEGACRGIHGTVADVIEVPGEYKTAVETALGSSMQDLIAEDEEAVRQAIGHLKQHRLGRATFLPLTVVKGWLPDAEKLPQDIVGLAVNLITNKPLYQGVMNSLLGRVLVCRDLPAAQRTAKQTNHRFKVVTLEGEVIFPGGAVTGGFEKKRDSFLLNRKQEILRLGEHKAVLKNQIEELFAAIQAQKKQEEEAGARAAELEKENQEAVSLSFTLNTKADYLSSEADSLSVRRQEVLAAVGQAQGEREDVLERIDASMSSLEVLEGEIEETGYTLSQLKANLASQQGLLSALQESITAIRIEKVSRQEKLHSLLERRQDMEQDEEGKKNLLKKIRAERILIEDEERHLQEQQAAGVETSLEFEGKKTGFVAALSSVKEQEDSLKMDSMAKEEEIRKVREELAVLKKEQYQLEVQKAKVETELQALTEKLEEYQLTLEVDTQEVKTGLSKTAMRSRIEAIKQEITLLGVVNTGAIDEFERVSERICFLEGQKSDLTSGQNSLLNIILEIDDKMSQKFLKTFEALNEKFKVVFEKLFGGGSAWLELADKENPLESGIEIIAKPPGKKMQSISLLSGGERALTAISLLFSLLLVKPAPFCILDEIDTSLDESNLEKFCAFLKEMDELVQFILITHRQQTMKIADILYGVTMEEAGISKLISVKLTEKAV